MNQPIRLKGKKEAQCSFKPDCIKSYSKNRTHTPTALMRSSSNLKKKTKSPFKAKNNQSLKIQENAKNQIVEIIQKDGHQINQSQKQKIQPTSYECQNCKKFRQSQKQLFQKIKTYQQNEKHFEVKYELLKKEYQKKIKKYKVKSRIQKDQLKLLKWILSQRKEFHQVLQRLQKMKEKGVQPLMDQKFQKQDLSDNQICLTDRTLPKLVVRQSYKFQQKQKSHINGIDQQRFSGSKQRQNQKFQHNILPTEREVQMYNHINVLEQQVMELRIKNDFLEKLKIKEKSSNINNSQEYLSNESISFNKDFTVSKYSKNHEPTKYYQKKEKTNYLQYDEYQNDISKQEYLNQSVQQFYDSFQRNRNQSQTQSRYIYPLKERNNVVNYRQQLIQKGQKSTGKNNDFIYESRSKYYDSIKERSRLLQI